MPRSVSAGITYLDMIFLLGMVVGTARTLALAPRVGNVAALLVELPLMLAASWLACGALIDRFKVPDAATNRLLMGGVPSCC